MWAPLLELGVRSRFLFFISNWRALLRRRARIVDRNIPINYVHTIKRISPPRKSETGFGTTRHFFIIYRLELDTPLFAYSQPLLAVLLTSSIFTPKLLRNNEHTAVCRIIFVIFIAKKEKKETQNNKRLI